MSPRIIEVDRHIDSRGWFCETWHAARLEATVGKVAFVQENHVASMRAGTLRGLHFQTGAHAQAKLVRCIAGRILDVIVDVRQQSPSYGQWAGVILSAENARQLFVPKGYAHGYLTLENDCEVLYKVDAHYCPAAEGGIVWNDPDLAIAWPYRPEAITLAPKDGALPPLSSIAPDFSYDGVPMPLTGIVSGNR